MASDGIKIRIPAFHRKVENLIEKELNKATQKRALTVWVLIIFILTSVILFGYFNVAGGNGSEKALMEYRYDPVRFLWKDISMLGILFLYILSATVMLWFIAKTLFKIKADFQLVLYAGGLGFLFLMAAFLLTILFRLIGKLPYLDIVGSILELLVWLSVPYVGFVVIKTVFKTTYTKSILLHIVNINAISIVFVILLLSYGFLLILISSTVSTNYTESILHNADGTLKVIYNYSKGDKSYQSCQITFPKDWVAVRDNKSTIEDPEYNIFYNNRTKEKVYVWRKTTVFGDYGDCKKRQGENITFDQYTYFISEDISFYDTSKYAFVCASKGTRGKMVAYQIFYRIVPNIGYEMDYLVSKDQVDSFGFIINNSKCEQGTDGTLWTELFYT